VILGADFGKAKRILPAKPVGKAKYILFHFGWKYLTQNAKNSLLKTPCTMAKQNSIWQLSCKQVLKMEFKNICI